MDFLFVRNHSNKPTTMETSKILTADVLDILFDGKNKEYGAYELRKTYNNRIKVSITGMFLVCAFCLGASMVANSKENKRTVLDITDVQLSNIKDETKPDLPPPPPPPQPEPPKVEMTTFTPPQIVKDELVRPEDQVKDIAVLEDTKIGPINQDGIKDPDMVAPPVETTKGIVEPPKKGKDIDDVVAWFR